MKTSRDLFILGAGSSVNYGFPLGPALKSEVISLLNDDNNVGKSLIVETGRHFNFQKSDVNEFLKRLELAVDDSSIDEFIESNEDSPKLQIWSNIAKVVTAYLIINSESTHKLKPARDWYGALFSRLIDRNRTFSRFPKNKVSFITFNYDRSLEKYLLDAVCERFGTPIAETSKMLKVNFPIIHVHGDVGEIWDNSGFKFEYGAPLHDSNTLAKAARRIRLITDRIKPAADPKFKRSRQSINNADLVHFIGFKYHSNNMERLGFNDPTAFKRRGDKFFGSTKGLTQQEITKLFRDYEINRHQGLREGAYSLALDFKQSGDACDYMATAPFN